MKFMPQISAEARFLIRVVFVVLAVAFCYVAIVGQVFTVVFNATPQRLERAGEMCLWLAAFAVCLLFVRALIPLLQGRRKLRNS